MADTDKEKEEQPEASDVEQKKSQPDKNVAEESDDEIELSKITSALLNAVAEIKPRDLPDEYTRISVSRAVSLLAIVYEKVRNAIEYREDHLIRRAAIERILRRRLAINPNGEGEGESLIRELLWARYFPKNSLSEDDVDVVQKIIEKYILVKNQLLKGKPDHEQAYLSTFLIDLMSCEIEEALSPDIAQREAFYTYFIFQTLHKTIKIDDVPEDMKDVYFLAALERSYRKLDRPYQRFHIYNLFYEPISSQSNTDLQEHIPKLKQMFERIDQSLLSPHVDKLDKYTKRQLPAYLILFEVITNAGKDAQYLLTSRSKLWEAVEKECNDKYKQIKHRLTTMAIRSLVYIFITKMLLAIILEYPVSMMLYNEAPLLPIIINSLFPPLLMIMIVLWFQLPGKDNTVRIYYRIIQTVNADPTFETRTALITKKKREKNSILRSIFTILYVATFGITLYVIHHVLNLLNFHFLSQLLFIFFVSVVSFFSYRIKQIINEYRLVEKESILAPIIDFFFVPILSLGKYFNMGVSKINFFTVIFDFIIEAPFKLIIDVIEEWIKFTRARKDEII